MLEEYILSYHSSTMLTSYKKHITFVVREYNEYLQEMFHVRRLLGACDKACQTKQIHFTCGCVTKASLCKCVIKSLEKNNASALNRNLTIMPFYSIVMEVNSLGQHY